MLKFIAYLKNKEVMEVRRAVWLALFLIFLPSTVKCLTKEERRRANAVKKELLQVLKKWDKNPPEVVKLVKKLAKTKKLEMGAIDWNFIKECFVSKGDCRMNIRPLLVLEYLIFDKRYSLEVKIIEGHHTEDKFHPWETIPDEAIEKYEKYKKECRRKGIQPKPFPFEQNYLFSSHILGEAIDIFRIGRKRINWDRKSKKLVRRLVKDIFQGQEKIVKRYEERWGGIPGFREDIEQFFPYSYLKYMFAPFQILVSPSEEETYYSTLQRKFFPSNIEDELNYEIGTSSTQYYRKVIEKELGFTYRDPLVDHVHIGFYSIGGILFQGGVFNLAAYIP